MISRSDCDYGSDSIWRSHDNCTMNFNMQLDPNLIRQHVCVWISLRSKHSCWLCNQLNLKSSSNAQVTPTDLFLISTAECVCHVFVDPWAQLLSQEVHVVEHAGELLLFLLLHPQQGRHHSHHPSPHYLSLAGRQWGQALFNNIHHLQLKHNMLTVKFPYIMDLKITCLHTVYFF